MSWNYRVCAHMCVCACCMPARVEARGQQWCLPLLFPTVVFEAGSLADLGIQMGQPANPGFLLSLPLTLPR